MRLNRYIAKSGIASRRKADILIRNGKISVNDIIVQEPSYNVTEEDSVKIGEKAIQPQDYVYVIFNKPKGVSSTLKDRFAKRTIIEVLPKELSKEDRRIYPVGRLDKDSRGLIILTNDGDLCYRATHPKFHVEKEYLVKLTGIFEKNDCQKALQGVRDNSDYLKIKKIEILRKGKTRSVCRVVVCEGRKRHLRRLFKLLGFEVVDLKRVRIGRLILGNLEEGRCRIIQREKIYSLLYKE
ncbi:MAG: rRNA pseudouridine synthase [Candidatus Omnitrophota bacterium]|nr:MAG: rRNA pseudouridine synthase [Candidatus Omnitrophota bacterium]